MKRTIGLLVACIAMATTAAALAQGSFPNQPIRFIVTTAAGGGLDGFARVLAKDLSARAGQQVVIDNRAGAGTTIGTAVEIGRAHV